jgi:putative YpdA family bacillithiol system oxidoreductase
VPVIYDIVVVGGGPAGLSSAVHAKKDGLNVLVLERGEVANTIFDYQKKKHVMAEPSMIPLRSDVPFDAGSREHLLEGWQRCVQEYKVQVNRPEMVHEITKTGDVFSVKSDKGVHQSKHVIVAIGIQGNPNRLGRPGEDLPHVSYKLSDPFIYDDQDIIMVGAGDAAIEGVLVLCEKNRVTVVNRNTEFFRLKDALDRQINDRVKGKQVTAYHSAAVDRVEPGYTFITLPDGVVKVKTDLVFIRIGASLPRPFLEKCGVTFATKDRNALPLISEHYESAVPGLYLIGAVAGYNLIKQGMNQGYEVVEHILGRAVEPVDEPIMQEKLSFMPGSTDERLATIARTIPLLADVQKQPLRELVLQSTIHRVGAGHLIFKENDFTDSLYLILDGEVGVSFSAQPAGEPPFRLNPGEFFGEMSLLSGRRRSGTVSTTTAATLIEIPRKAMLRLMANEPPVKRALDEVFIMRSLRTYVLKDLDIGFAQEVARKAEIKSFKKDEVICKEGEAANAFYVIRSGSVKVTKHEGTKELVLNYLPAGKHFGEIGLLNPDTRRTATATATTRTEIIELKAQEFQAILQRHPEYEQKLRADIQRLLIRQQAMEIMPGQGVFQRALHEDVFVGTDVLLIDENKCVRCDNCVKACADTHNGQTRLYRDEGIIFGNLNVPTSCRHCENPMCLTDCPPGDAIQRDPKGEVFINEDRCIGCGNCAANCPYGVIFMLHAKPKTGALGRLLSLIGLGGTEHGGEEMPTKAVKCDLCREDTAGPACVRSCPTGAAVRVSPAEYFEKVQSAG